MPTLTLIELFTLKECLGYALSQMLDSEISVVPYRDLNEQKAIVLGLYDKIEVTDESLVLRAPTEEMRERLRTK